MTDGWLELWAEFNFDNPDAAGYRGASKTQLEAVLGSAEQRVDIHSAVEEGYLREITTTDRYGLTRTVRYRLDIAGGGST